MAFPVLSRQPLPENVTIEYIDISVGNNTEDLYIARRPRITKKPREFTVSYDYLSEADKILLVNHYETVDMYIYFDWIDPDGNTYIVCYNKPIKYSRFIPGWYKFETLELREQ